ncbi:hypothetical protein HZS_388 [Henneguya salminicola]|nr:hypothetical protein HZS_388 [Henneguya salminicola]
MQLKNKIELPVLELAHACIVRLLPQLQHISDFSTHTPAKNSISVISEEAIDLYKSRKFNYMNPPLCFRITAKSCEVTILKLRHL